MYNERKKIASEIFYITAVFLFLKPILSIKIFILRNVGAF